MEDTDWCEASKYKKNLLFIGSVVLRNLILETKRRKCLDSPVATCASHWHVVRLLHRLYQKNCVVITNELLAYLLDSNRGCLHIVISLSTISIVVLNFVFCFFSTISSFG